MAHLLFYMRSQVIFQKKSIKAFERPLDGKRLAQKIGTVNFFFDGDDKAVYLSANNFRAVYRPFFELLIEHIHTIYPHTLFVQQRGCG